MDLELELDRPAALSPHGAEKRDSVPPPAAEPRPSGPRGPTGDTPAAPFPLSDPTSSPERDSSLTPPLTTPRFRATHTPASLDLAETQPPWTSRAKLDFAAAISLPALVAFAALHFVPVVLAPLGHAMRGDSSLASGVLTVLTLVGASALAVRALAASRSSGTLLATVGAVLLGIVMIIVTFSASETADLDVSPPAGGIVPFVAPLVPLGLGLSAFARAREAWRSGYDRSEAIKLVALTSLLLFAFLELSPIGAIRAATASSAATSPSAPAPALPSPP